MTIAIVIDETWEAQHCLSWASRFARAKETGLVALVLAKNRSQDSKVAEPVIASQAESEVATTVLQLIEEHPDLALEPENEEQVPVTVVELLGGQPTPVVLETIRKRSVSLCIIPRHVTERGLDRELDWERDLFLQATCETMLFRATSTQQTGLADLLVPVDGQPPSEVALRWARTIAEAEEAHVTALYVEPDIGDDAARVGEMRVDLYLHRVFGRDSHCRKDVVVSSSVKEAIADRAERCGLLVVGSNRLGVGSRWRSVSISEWLMARKSGPPVAVIRPALPLGGRVWQTVDRILKAYVPQLDRQHRIVLVERVEGSSQWSFDFSALICLSTLIAGMGLLQSSPAVVIGAMLVAPLMTPILAAGLSLVQGNRVLIRRASYTVLGGFLMAFAIGILLGCLPGDHHPSSEMLARGSPNVLDFAVALISGVAAAYAMGRPNLLSALPGVAIAAALVPPIATSGVALAWGEYSLMAGALLLFVTNILAIVLGTAAALWAVGLRPMHAHGILDSWVTRLLVVLVVLAAAIGAYEAVPRDRDLLALQQTLQQQSSSATNVLEVSRQKELIRVVLASPTPTTDAAVREIDRVAREQLGNAIQVVVETRLESRVGD